MNRYKYLYTFLNDGTTKNHGLVKITDKNYVTTKENPDQTIPLEDYGDYLLTPKPCKKPYETWLLIQLKNLEVK
jgi:hypothetical protein